MMMSYNRVQLGLKIHNIMAWIHTTETETYTNINEHIIEVIGLQLVVELAQQSHSSLDPVLLWLVCWQLHGHHKVSGVSRCGESASPVARLVERDGVRLTIGDIISLARLQPNLKQKIRLHNE